MSTSTTRSKGLTIGRLMIGIGLLAVFLAPVVWSVRQVRVEQLQALRAMQRAETARLEAIKAALSERNARAAEANALRLQETATKESEAGTGAVVGEGSETNNGLTIERMTRDKQELRRKIERLRAELEAARGGHDPTGADAPRNGP